MTEEGEAPLRAVMDSMGFFVKVETVDGAFYTGKLSRLDMLHGDVELTDVRCQRRDSSLSVECRVLLKGTNVRLIHLPSDIRKATYLEWENPSVHRVLKNSLKSRRPRGFKKNTSKTTKTKKVR
ncbi:small nuclear ribonucleoprotein [Trypanosoma rangeli]|uniref:Small nuclear ribonucleoprotein n=1 Tax=Trypanosoma rangeli TaxID=5698 RepID=A0A3S5ISK5_TRYRA|nr:small nuclear ribonucleoprotein [Trypanosoma rangeli]RNF11835.1 small nuclear ribonucleoprotein [Trypanosoma rangeli]|eukprot:RNF11835.1 small nuclear ribonucleoprotein [Trypanosoma rangeli]